MKWLRNYGWLIAIGLVVVSAMWLRPRTRPDPKEAIAQFEAQRAEMDKQRAEWAARQAEFDRQIDGLRVDGTSRMLRLVGDAYREHLAAVKKPPQAADFGDLVGAWKSDRDGRPLVIVWGVDLNKLPNGGAGLALAWEETGGSDGSRCVLMADGKTTKVVTAAEFETLPKAKPAGG